MRKRWRRIAVMLLLAGLSFPAWGLNSATVTITGSEQQVSGNWDRSTVTMAFNGFQETVAYGEYSSAASVASNLAAKFSNDYLPEGLCAYASGAQITFKLQGTATFGTLYVGGSTASFQVGSPTGFIAEASKADAGTVTLTVNGVTAAATNYGEGSTPDTIADGLADGLVSGSPVSITADDDTIELTSTASGATTNYSYSLSIESTAGYAPPSFTASPASGSLAGGANASTTTQTVYYYNLLYAPNSNVIGYDDEIMGTWAFTYDSLNRLATATEGTGPTPPAGIPNAAQGLMSDYCWSYDQWGNRTQQLGATTAFPSTAGGPAICNTSQPQFVYNTNNQMTSSPTGAPVYDAAGDITTGTAGNVYLYDAEGRICAVATAGMDGMGPSMTGYVYDAAGNRVAKGPITTMSCDPTKNGFETSGEESDYISNQQGQVVTKITMAAGAMTWNYTNVYADGQLFATYDAQGLHFALNDWLGTRRVTTDYAGVVEQTCASLPYGDQLNCTGSVDAPNEQHFTAKTHDTESGLDYFGARYYNENDARFMSPDRSEVPDTVPYAEFENPQTLNLYSYGNNNPLLDTDSDGHDVNVCSTDSYGDQQCTLMSNEQYQAAQQANNGGLNVPTLDQVGGNSSNGNFNATAITDANGNTVGTATYVPENPGIDPFVGNNEAGYQTLQAARTTINYATAGYAAILTAAFLGPEAVEAGLGLANKLRAGMTIGGYILTQHAVEQAEERGVTLSEIKEALSGVAKGNPNNPWDSVQRFYTSTCEVRVNKITGTIVTIINKIKR